MTAATSLAAVTITTTSKTFAKEGGAASVSTGGSGTWTATTAASWITLNRASGNAGVSCVYVVSANYSADTRSATIDIGGNTYTVTQTGYTATISPTSASADNAGGSGTISVTVDAGVSWTATANANWLSVSPASGMSAGSVSYTIEPYEGTTPRTGSITVAGQTFTVSQTGNDVSLDPNAIVCEYNANVFEVSVAALSSTSWTITPQASWISVVDDGYGYGNSTIMIAVGENPSVATRTGTVRIGSKTLTVTQKGMTNPTLSITPTEATASPVGAYGNVAVYATPDATWSAESLSPWLTISEGAAGTGNGNIKYIAAANPTLSTRQGRIKVTPPHHTPNPDIYAGLACKIEESYNCDGSSPRWLTWDTTSTAIASSEPMPDDFSRALNSPMTFTTDGDADWYIVEDDTLDGQAMRSGAVGDNKKSYLRTSVNGSGTLTFWYKRSTNHGGCSFKCSIDGTAILSTIGEGNWTFKSVSVTGSGIHSIVWWFEDTESGSNSGSMCGWLDRVTWAPANIGSFSANPPSTNRNDFCRALNSSLNFSSYGYGASSWYVVEDESVDGQAMRSGVVGDNQKSYLQTSVNGPGTLTFWYKEDSPGDSYGKFKCSIDKTETLSLYGNWTFKSVSVTGSGTHSVVWWFEDTAYGSNSDSMCGWLDRVTWTPSESLFNGTSPIILNGAAFPSKESNDFSVSLSFKVGELGRVNRLLSVGGRSLYLDISNHVVFENTASEWSATTTNTWYTLALRQDADGVVSVFAGEKGGTLELVLETPCATILNFKSGDIAAGEFVLGATDLPSPGYLTDGDMANLRIWARSLTDEEMQGADTLEGAFHDDAPASAPSGSVWNYFPLDGSALNDNSSNPFPSTAGRSPYSAFGIAAVTSRFGTKRRSIFIPSDGFLDLWQFNSFFASLETSATYSFWFMVDTLPASGEISLVRRGGLDETVEVALLPSGALRLDNNGGLSTFSTRLVEPKRWHMLTLVGVSGQSLQLYLDDTEIGNVSSSLSLGHTSTPRYLDFSGGARCMDDLTIFHSALTSAQVRSLYEAGKAPIVYHTVTQGVIDPVVTPDAIAFAAAGGSTNVQLTVAANTQWTAASGANWITVTSSSSSAGSARVSFDVAANPSTEVRTGTLTLAGKTVTVTQSGLWSQLTYDGTVFSETSDSGFIDVQVEGNGTWTASTDASWLTLLDDGGRGSGSVMFVVDDFNTTVASRTAAVTIAGKTVYITQRGYQLSIDPAVAEIGSNAGAGEVGISAPIGAIWEAIVTADWITLVGGSTGSGSGTLRYTVADNTTGGTRTGKIVISGQEYTVTQLCSLKLETATEGEGTVVGAGNYDTNARATLTATPAAGYAFTHWSGDAVGVSNVVSFIMDTSKKVTAHFIPESAAQRLAEEKAAQGGFYTREQIHTMELGNLLFDVDSSTGKARIGVKLMETSSLSNPDWKPVNVSAQDLDIGADGSVGISAPATGNAKFFRVISGE